MTHLVRGGKLSPTESLTLTQVHHTQSYKDAYDKSVDWHVSDIRRPIDQRYGKNMYNNIFMSSFGLTHDYALMYQKQIKRQQSS